MASGDNYNIVTVQILGKFGTVTLLEKVCIKRYYTYAKLKWFLMTTSITDLKFSLSYLLKLKSRPQTQIKIIVKEVQQSVYG